MLARIALALALIGVSGVVSGATASGPNAPVRVAFVISANFNVIDFAGPWEVFQDAVIESTTPGVEGRPAFELYTVAPSLAA